MHLLGSSFMFVSFNQAKFHPHHPKKFWSSLIFITMSSTYTSMFLPICFKKLDQPIFDMLPLRLLNQKTSFSISKSIFQCERPFYSRLPLPFVHGNNHYMHIERISTYNPQQLTFFFLFLAMGSCLIDKIYSNL